MRLWVAFLLAVLGAVQVRAGMLSDSSLYYCKCECRVIWAELFDCSNVADAGSTVSSKCGCGQGMLEAAVQISSV